MGMRRVGYMQNDRRVGGASGERGGREREGRGAVKTMIAFHQVRPIFYSSLKQSNLQKDNYALAPFYLLQRAVPGLDSSGAACLHLCKLPAIGTCSPSRLNWAIN